VLHKKGRMGGLFDILRLGIRYVVGVVGSNFIEAELMQ
jgi:hypothetical protein